jgi:hypothetical protein
MTNRFDLEQQLIDCWKVTDDLQLAFELSVDNEDPDRMANLLLGMKTLYELKFNKLWDTFETCVQNRDI